MFLVRAIKSSPATCHGGAWGERSYSFYSFLTSALERGERSASRPGLALPRGKDLRYPLYRRLGRPQSRSGHRGYSCYYFPYLRLLMSRRTVSRLWI
jgi:hypothetical protein